jgi:hypothetical protein
MSERFCELGSLAVTSRLKRSAEEGQLYENVEQSSELPVKWLGDVEGRRALTGHVRFEVFTALTVKNVVFWDIKPSSYFTGDTLRLRYRVQPVNSM